MPDISHLFGNDLSFGPTGDLAVADIPDVTTQRVIRRLMTNAGDYIWQLQYGAGLPSLVGQPARVNAIRGLIRGQMLQEAGVSQDPVPTVTVSSSLDNTVYASVIYADANTGTTQTVNLRAAGTLPAPTTGTTTGTTTSASAPPFILDTSSLDSGAVLG